MDKCFKNKLITIEAKKDPLSYRKKPRLQSAVSMMRATDFIALNMEALSTPVCILHGEADEVTCPEISKELFNRCSSKDKTLKIYPTCWHNLLVGEPEEISKGIFNDVVDWIKSR